MAIVGISGSPIPGGNTDRITKAILAESGKETTWQTCNAVLAT